MSDPGVGLVICSIFSREVELLRDEYWPNMPIRRVNSMLHLRPDLLAIQLEQAIDEELAQGYQVLLIYGDCCASMTRFEKRAGVARLQTLNCCEMILGKAAYRQMEHAGVFFLLPEWARRWKTIFTNQLGLNQTNATDLMQELHTKLVYLDTGLDEAPHNELQACADFTGLPYEILPVSLDYLRLEIEKTISNMVSHKEAQ